MALTEEQRFQVRYYLGFPDLSSLPPVETEDEEELVLLTRSSELETRMSNLTPSAEQRVVRILVDLETAFGEFSALSSRFPFKRIEDITFRDNEIELRWQVNAGSINFLASILGMAPLQPMVPGIGLAIV